MGAGGDRKGESHGEGKEAAIRGGDGGTEEASAECSGEGHRSEG